MRLSLPPHVATPDEPPRALVERVGGGMRLSAVDEAAAALGLAPGLSMADARACVPALELFDAAPTEDRAWLEQLADGCTRYTPIVALDPAHGLILDTTGCAHLFAGESGLAIDLKRRLARSGVTARHGFADTPEAARAFARHLTGPVADEAIAIRLLPVAALELDDAVTLALRRAGLKTIGDVACRPLAGIAARFGQGAVTMIRRMLGEADSLLMPRRVAPPIGVERRFAEPIASTETALGVLAELAAEAARELAEAERGGRRFEAIFYRSDGMVRRLRIETGSASRDVPALMRLFRERIDGLSDPIDPGFGFDLIRLNVPLAEPLSASQLRLEGGAAAGADADVAALIDRLSARLGRDRIRLLAPRDTHIPEQAEFSLPALDTGSTGAWPVPQVGEPPLRPIHLFDPPQSIDVLGAEVPDGPPRRFRWRRSLHEVTRFEGPERIAAEWWRRRPVPILVPVQGRDDDDEALAERFLLGDAPDRTRDYYRVEDTNGRRFWIFRHGFFLPEKPMPIWYLHGLFA